MRCWSKSEIGGEANKDVFDARAMNLADISYDEFWSFFNRIHTDRFQCYRESNISKMYVYP